jgi:hypothetical protein
MKTNGWAIAALVLVCVFSTMAAPVGSPNKQDQNDSDRPAVKITADEVQTDVLVKDRADKDVNGTESEVGQGTQEQCNWLADLLVEAETVKVGVTRASLLKVFTTEGGLSTGLRRTYVLRRCHIVKVDVEFDPTGRQVADAEGRATLIESDDDVIVKISRPYLAWGVAD